MQKKTINLNALFELSIAESAGSPFAVMICQDGFITNHTVENIELLEDEEVKNFVGEYELGRFLLNHETNVVGPYSVTSYTVEQEKSKSLENAKMQS